MSVTERNRIWARIAWLISCLLLAVASAILASYFLGPLEYGGPSVTFLERTDHPALLLDGVPSYATARDVRRWLETRGLPVDRQDESPGPGPPRPPFDFLTFTVSGYPLGGCEGEAAFILFNDRLMDAVFRFSDCARPLEEIIEAGTVGPPEENEHLRVIQAVDHRNEQYVSWVDERLEHEVRLWIKRYS